MLVPRTTLGSPPTHRAWCETASSKPPRRVKAPTGSTMPPVSHMSSASVSSTTVPISRPRLLEALNHQPIPPIIVVVAPAGYGKTTLISQWTEMRSTPAAWVRLGSEHNTPHRFLHGVLQAIGRQPDAPPSLDTALESIRRLATCQPGSVVVLDDFHVIENPEVHQMASELVAGLPAGLHLVIMSRAMPPLPLARRRIEGEVRDIQMQDLSFIKEEVGWLAESVYGSTVSPEMVSHLTARTDGWIAGIRLALASADAMDPQRTSSIMDAWHTQQSLDEYVIEEVLATLPEDLHDFILRTAFLPYLEPDLCNHVLEIDHSAALIADASRRVVFVRPSSPSSSTLRYHALFAASAIRIAERHYPSSDLRRRQLRAATWFGQRDDWEAALDQAVQAEAWDDAIRYARIVGKDLMDRDMSASRRYWLEKFPEEHLLADDDLARWLISALFYTGEVQRGIRLYARIKPRWEASTDPRVRGYLASTEAFEAVMNGDDGRTLRSLYTALHEYPPTDHLERLHAWAGIMEQEIYRGNDSVANQAYRQALLCLQQLPSDQAWGLKVHEYRANHLALRGELSSAIELYKRILTGLPAVFDYRAANIQARLAELYLERNDLDAAAQAASEVEGILERTPSFAWHSEVMLTVARVRASWSEMDAAWQALDRARSIQESSRSPALKDKADATEAWVWLMTDTPDLAHVWAALFDPEQPWRPVYVGDLDPRIVWIRCQIARGELARANDLLWKLREVAVETGRWAEMVSLAMWHVVMSLEQGDEDGAIESLRLAIQHGRAGGFVRSFLTPGYDLSPFIRQTLPGMEQEEAAFIFGLLEHGLWSVLAGPGADGSGAEHAALLSDRERDVVNLLAMGFSNRDIGDHLFITERTAKKHVSNILRKLQVPNRTSAVSRARELNLLD